MSFKIIAIRPLKNCNQKFIKNLKKNQIYKLYNDYTFVLNDISGRVTEINYSSSVPSVFFNVDRYIKIDVFGNTKNIPIEINISALVGENGSGKSAISELFIAALFIISNKLGFVVKENFLDGEKPEEEEKYEEDLPNLLNGIAVEIFYILDNELFRLVIDKNKIFYEKCTENNGSFKLTNKTVNVNSKKELPPFFYSMVVNYSFYGFNSNQIGMWIKAFFHKNDGYQMPIVINPYRDKGIMDINTENILTRARVLANVLTIKDYKNINVKSPIKEIELTFNKKKNYRFFKDETPRFSERFIHLFRTKILTPLFLKTFNNEFEYPKIDTEIKKLAEIYLIQKLITIPTRYVIFKPYDKRPAKKRQRQDNYNITLKAEKEYVKALYEDRSHITLKVRQTLNYLRKDIFNFRSGTSPVILNLSSIEQAMKESIEENWFTELVDYLPPPFLVSKIRFQDESYFDDLSSGEKQKIYSLNSIIYHLKNIDSVHKNIVVNKQKGIFAYENINLLFDEIELYYHPDFQKSIVFELLNFIKSANYEFINNINMIFLTHSPFILSDIPNQNIMYLKEGECLNGIERPRESFGANITDLLSHSFFFSNTDKALMGDFAKKKITEVIDFLSDENNVHISKSDCYETILIIDEPLIRYKLQEKYYEKFPQDFQKNIAVERLKEEALKLGFTIQKQ